MIVEVLYNKQWRGTTPQTFEIIDAAGNILNLSYSPTSLVMRTLMQGNQIAKT